MDIDVISMEELLWAIRKLKRNKAPGPDGVPTECYKDMHEDQLKFVLEIINNWWAGAPIETEATRAQVILLFKKGAKTIDQTIDLFPYLTQTIKYTRLFFKNASRTY